MAPSENQPFVQVPVPMSSTIPVKSGNKPPPLTSAFGNLGQQPLSQAQLRNA